MKNQVGQQELSIKLSHLEILAQTFQKENIGLFSQGY